LLSASSGGYDQSQLNEVGARFPVGVEWLNPKALDFSPWRQRFVQLRRDHRALRQSVTTVRAAPLPALPAPGYGRATAAG
jgi:hypothetical protein